MFHRHRDRSGTYPALPNLGAVTLRSNNQLPSLIFTSSYPAYLLYSLLVFIEKLTKWSDQGGKAAKLLSRTSQLFFNESLLRYVTNINSVSLVINNSKCHINWFIKVEILLLLNIIKSMRWNQSVLEPSVVLKVGFHLLSCLSQELIMEIVFVFDEVVFNQSYFAKIKTINNEKDGGSDGDGLTSDKEKFQQWKSFYCNAVLSSLTADQV